KDLDSETVLEENKFYHIAATYNGRFVMIYINGRLESFSSFSGQLNASPLDMEIGQYLPDDPSYSFRGILDEIKIYDYAQLPDSVAAESGAVITGTHDDQLIDYISLNVFPNPALKSLTIEIPSSHIVNPSSSFMTIFDINGIIELNTVFNAAPTTNIDISALHPGLHFLRIIYDGKSMVRKFITE
ncbi:MAG: LamG-like jellyroll fold domain-containing protein, partial [Saprospiraceae bacterium]